jgi:hypothetical protein
LVQLSPTTCVGSSAEGWLSRIKCYYKKEQNTCEGDRFEERDFICFLLLPLETAPDVVGRQAPLILWCSSSCKLRRREIDGEQQPATEISTPGPARGRGQGRSSMRRGGQLRYKRRSSLPLATARVVPVGRCGGSMLCALPQGRSHHVAGSGTQPRR